MPVLDLRAPRVVELHDLRIAGGSMLGAGLVRGFMHHPPGVPCLLRRVTGIPCPLCGMTTSVTAATHAHLGQALAANPAGVLVVVAAIALLVLHRADRVTVPGWLLPAGLSLMWLFELFRFGIL